MASSASHTDFNGHHHRTGRAVQISRNQEQQKKSTSGAARFRNQTWNEFTILKSIERFSNAEASSKPNISC